MLKERQLELADRLSQPVNRRRTDLLPGEQGHKKRLAMIMRLSKPGITLREISAELGESETTVKNWFAEPEVKEEFEFILSHLDQAAIDHLQNYELEAIATLVTLMRFGSEKYMYDSAMSILGMRGITPVSKSEITKNDNQSISLDDNLLERIRDLPEDKKEEVARGLEEMGDFLEKVVNGE